MRRTTNEEGDSIVLGSVSYAYIKERLNETDAIVDWMPIIINFRREELRKGVDDKSHLQSFIKLKGSPEMRVSPWPVISAPTM